jgi:hypothetical protein
MAYDRSQLKLSGQSLDGTGKEWVYTTTDSLSTVGGAGYFSDGAKLGMTIGDWVIITIVDNPANPTTCTAAGHRVVSTVNASTGAATAGVTPA